MISRKASATPELPKFKNSSDPRQRLQAMIYAVKNFFPAQNKATRKSKDRPAEDRTIRRILATFAKAEKKAFVAFGLDATSEIDREILLACLSWTLFGKSARRGRQPSQDKNVEEIRQRIASQLVKDPTISDTDLGKILRKDPAERRKSDTLRKLVSKARR